MKEIILSNSTDYAHIMKYADCETILHRLTTDVKYFKVLIDNNWHEFHIGDIIKINKDGKIYK